VTTNYSLKYSPYHRTRDRSPDLSRIQRLTLPSHPMAPADEEEASLSIPSLAFVAFLSFFIIRYFISSRSSDSATSRRAGQRFTGAQVEQLAQMFPQLSRRDIMWDLQRNGGSVAATTERVLAGRGLERVCSSIRGAVLWLMLSAGTAFLSTTNPHLHQCHIDISNTCSRAQSCRTGSDYPLQSPFSSQLQRKGKGGTHSSVRLGSKQGQAARDATASEGRNDSCSSAQDAGERAGDILILRDLEHSLCNACA
jgi:CUE domain